MEHIILSTMVVTASFCLSREFIKTFVEKSNLRYYYSVSFIFTLSNFILYLLFLLFNGKNTLIQSILSVLLNGLFFTLGVLLPFIFLREVFKSTKSMVIAVFSILALNYVFCTSILMVPFFDLGSIKFQIGLNAVVFSAFFTSFGSIQYLFSFVYYPLNSSKVHSKLTEIDNLISIVREEKGDLECQRDNSGKLETFMKDLLKWRHSLAERLYYTAHSEANKTGVWHRLKTVTGIALTAYSAVRIVTSCFSLLTVQYDKIETVLEEELSTFDKALSVVFSLIVRDYLDIQYFPLFEQIVSLCLMLAMILVNFRSLLISLRFLYIKLFSKAEAVKPKTKALILCYMIGLFYLSSIILLVFSLPITFRSLVLEVVGNVNINSLRKTYDWSFLIGCAINTVIEVLFVFTLPS